jgi:cytochrome c biogenesis protein CcdA
MEDDDDTTAATLRAVNIVAAEDHDDRTAAWLMLGVVAAFKVGLTVWVVLAFQSSQNLITNIALNWPWFILLVVIAVALLTAPVLFWVRRMRVRAKRAQLQHAEWNVD